MRSAKSKTRQGEVQVRSYSTGPGGPDCEVCYLTTSVVAHSRILPHPGPDITSEKSQPHTKKRTDYKRGLCHSRLLGSHEWRREAPVRFGGCAERPRSVGWSSDRERIAAVVLLKKVVPSRDG